MVEFDLRVVNEVIYISLEAHKTYVKVTAAEINASGDVNLAVVAPRDLHIDWHVLSEGEVPNDHNWTTADVDWIRDNHISVVDPDAILAYRVWEWLRSWVQSDLIA